MKVKIVPTPHEKLMVFLRGNGLNGFSYRDMEKGVDALLDLADMNDKEGLIAKLREFVPEYVPETGKDAIVQVGVGTGRMERVPYYKPYEGGNAWKKVPNKGAYAFKWIEELQVLVERDDHGKLKDILQNIEEKYKLFQQTAEDERKWV